MRSAVCFVLAFAAACGPTESNTPDAGTPDPAYWGLVDQECLHYSDGTASTYSVSITKDTTTVGGVTTWQVISRQNGFEINTKWLAPTAKTLAIYREHIPPTPPALDTVITYGTTQPDYLAEGLTMNSPAHITNATATSSTGSSMTTVNEEFTINVEGGNVMLPANGMMVQATHFFVTEAPMSGSGPSESSELWFAPNVGIVQIGQTTGTGAPWALTSIGQNMTSTQCSP
jgi:hypothetical protein